MTEREKLQKDLKGLGLDNTEGKTLIELHRAAQNQYNKLMHRIQEEINKTK